MKSSRMLGILLVGVVAVWAGSFFAIRSFLPELPERGQFGDMFGAVNSLFTGLAFAGLIATIFLQKDELALQREELKLQRQEMILSRGELANQARVQHAQYLAAIGQIRVASLEARIEAINMRSNEVNPGYRGPYAEQIEKLAEQIFNVAVDVESVVKLAK